MLIVAAFSPPNEVLAELRAAIQAGESTWAADTAESTAAPTRRRWFGRPAAAPAIDPAPIRTCITLWPSPTIPVVRFGNLTTADARRVAEAIAAVAAEWTPATVQFERVLFGTKEEPRSVQAVLGGEVNELDTVARAVTSRAADLNFYLDRRLFHPVLEVGQVADGITGEDLAALTATVADYRGTPWTVDHVSVLKQTFGDGAPTFVEEFAIPIGPT